MPAHVSKIANEAKQNAYAYRANARIPEFDDSLPVAVMDGQCALCTFGARMIVKFDKKQSIRICPVQSDLGTALLLQYGINPEDPESWLFLENGRAWSSFDAWIKAGESVGGIGNVMRIFWLMPRPVRDWIYRRIARNRVAVFGRADLCALPDERLRARLIGNL